jgi:hypothetical protein
MAFNRSNKKTFLSVAKLGWFLGLSLLTGCDGPQVAPPPPDATVGTKNRHRAGDGAAFEQLAQVVGVEF